MDGESGYFLIRWRSLIVSSLLLNSRLMWRHNMNPDTIGCVSTSEFDLNTLCMDGNFWIWKEKVADSNIRIRLDEAWEARLVWMASYFIFPTVPYARLPSVGPINRRYGLCVSRKWKWLRNSWHGEEIAMKSFQKCQLKRIANGVNYVNTVYVPSGSGRWTSILLLPRPTIWLGDLGFFVKTTPVLVRTSELFFVAFAMSTWFALVLFGPSSG